MENMLLHFAGKSAQAIIKAPFIERELRGIDQSSSVILKFELLHAPKSATGYEFQGSPDAFSASIHEYKIPPNGLLGLHSYCPFNFDAFHTSVHVSLLKASHHTSRPKVTLITALMTAHEILLEDLKRISIGQAVDLAEITSASDVTEWSSYTPPANVNGDSSPQLSDRAHKTAHSINKLTDPFSWDGHLSSSLQSLGNQIRCLWNIFLKFHRENKTKIMEFLRNSWAEEQRIEWSIWMVYSKVAMPHQPKSNGAERHVYIWRSFACSYYYCGRWCKVWV
ncbi:hypothetical protein PIB30_015998 [Stylosanthes scabra]|uniref:Uncharacterized protein n=1 Tax=Stylosanthes scabra TaxID=79078 RepID=A0ABU6X8W7_9FABA|nr:hypothetical protein [Stylosanthes scabra]